MLDIGRYIAIRDEVHEITGYKNGYFIIEDNKRIMAILINMEPGYRSATEDEIYLYELKKTRRT